MQITLSRTMIREVALSLTYSARKARIVLTCSQDVRIASTFSLQKIEILIVLTVLSTLIESTKSVIYRENI